MRAPGLALKAARSIFCIPAAHRFPLVWSFWQGKRRFYIILTTDFARNCAIAVALAGATVVSREVVVISG